MSQPILIVLTAVNCRLMDSAIIRCLKNNPHAFNRFEVCSHKQLT